MKANRVFALLIGAGLLATGAVWINSCSDSNQAIIGDDVPALLSISPAENATGVDRNFGIHMRFSMAMDTTTVRRNFHLAGGTEMEQWMDSLPHHQGMGGMGMMNMEHMMDWMDSLQYGGEFHWNSAMDSCEFDPDSGMMPDANQMIYIYQGVRGNNDKVMDMSSLPYSGIMHHFRTKP